MKGKLIAILCVVAITGLTVWSRHNEAEKFISWAAFAETVPPMTHVYTVPGDYMAKLTVVDSAGNMAQATVPIKVLPAATPVVAAAIADLTSGKFPLKVQLVSVPAYAPPPR